MDPLTAIALAVIVWVAVGIAGYTVLRRGGRGSAALTAALWPALAALVVAFMVLVVGCAIFAAIATAVWYVLVGSGEHRPRRNLYPA